MDEKEPFDLRPYLDIEEEVIQAGIVELAEGAESSLSVEHSASALIMAAAGELVELAGQEQYEQLPSAVGQLCLWWVAFCHMTGQAWNTAVGTQQQYPENLRYEIKALHPLLLCKDIAKQSGAALQAIESQNGVAFRQLLAESMLSADALARQDGLTLLECVRQALDININNGALHAW